MTDRERLTALLMAGAGDCLGKGGALNCSKLADYLISNGVTVPPCKVGDTVWLIKNVFNGEKVVRVIAHRMIDGIGGNRLNPIWLISKYPYELRFCPSEFGKTVFLTHEEAERALKERESNG